MRTFTHRLAAIVMGTLLAAQTVAPVALAAPASSPVSSTWALVPQELFQNGCNRDRVEQELAAVEGREVEDIEEVNLRSWRRAFTTTSRFGAPESKWCWFGDQFGQGDSPRSR